MRNSMSKTFRNTEKKLKNVGKQLKSLFCRPLEVEVHRGAGNYEYENTLKAFAWAIDHKIQRIELDVWLLSDGEVAVIHGEKDGFITLKDGTKHLIESLDYPTLKSEAILPNGCYIPLFREVLELCRGKLRVNVELKGERLELLEKVFEIARNAGSFAEICFSSFFHAFYPRFVQLKREFLVETPVSFGFLLWQEAETREFFAQLPEKPEKLKENRNTVNLEITLLVEFPWIREKVLEILRKGVQICVYFPFRTKETLQNLMFLSKLSVDRVICNDPFVVQRFNELF